MAVFVDNPRWKYGRMTMCHMMADSLDELHEMADKIGLKREWYQPESSPHYDVCKRKRALAIKHGAIEADRKQIVSLIRKYRSEAH